MIKLKQKFKTRRFEGDDQYSWAIFRAEDVVGTRGNAILFSPKQPLMCGMSQDSARRTADIWNREGKQL